jgi:hypothetical protein
MFVPKNEQGVIALFMMRAASANWHLESIGTRYPDAVLQKNGETWNTEFEYMASNFVLHGHDCRECDLIVCWINDLHGFVIPIVALSEIGWESLSPAKAEPLLKELQYWRQLSRRLEKENKALRASIADLEETELKEEEIVEREYVDNHTIGCLMLDAYKDEPAISDEKLANRLGLPKKRIQDVRADLAAKEVICIQLLTKGKIVTVNGNEASYREAQI